MSFVERQKQEASREPVLDEELFNLKRYFFPEDITNLERIVHIPKDCEQFFESLTIFFNDFVAT